MCHICFFFFLPAPLETFFLTPSLTPHSSMTSPFFPSLLPIDVIEDNSHVGYFLLAVFYLSWNSPSSRTARCLFPPFFNIGNTGPVPASSVSGMLTQCGGILVHFSRLGLTTENPINLSPIRPTFVSSLKSLAKLFPASDPLQSSSPQTRPSLKRILNSRIALVLVGRIGF